MVRRLVPLGVAVLVVPLLTGCAGALLALVLGGLATGSLIGQIQDLLGRPATSYTVYLNGYDTGVHPSPSGALNLTGLPAGTHLLSLTSSDQRVGYHQVISVTGNSSVNLGAVNLIQGAVIGGRVERLASGVRVPLAGVRVAAIAGGTALLAAGATTPLDLPPTATSPTTVMTTTNDQGYYLLGPCAYGDWLVSAAYPSLTGDVTLCTVSAGNNAAHQDLLLEPTTALAPATVRGVVTQERAGVLAGALVNADLATPWQPTLNPARRTALETQVGAALRAEPWINWHSFLTTSEPAGTYELEVPAGTATLYGYKFGYQGRSTHVNLTAGAVQNLDFALPRR